MEDITVPIKPGDTVRVEYGRIYGGRLGEVVRLGYSLRTLVVRLGGHDYDGPVDQLYLLDEVCLS